MELNVEGLCTACKNCKYFEIEQKVILMEKEKNYVVAHPFSKEYRCKHVEICKNAIDIFWDKRASNIKTEIASSKIKHGSTTSAE